MKWSTFAPQQNPVSLTHRLRGEEAASLHFIKGGQQYLAVASTNPYGLLDPLSRQQYDGAPFLQALESGDDFTVLAVPDELLTLRAIIAGTGRRKGLELRGVFERMGRAVGAVLEQAAVPRLTAEDIAVSRQSGDVFFLPPLAFTESTASSLSDRAQLFVGIENSLAYFPDNTAQQLMQNMDGGMHESVT